MSSAYSSRAYVLGPPEDEGLLKRSLPTKAGKEAYEFASDLAFDEALAAVFGRLGSGREAHGRPNAVFAAH